MFAAVVTGGNDVNTGEARNVFDDGCRATPGVLHMGTMLNHLIMIALIYSVLEQFSCGLFKFYRKVIAIVVWMNRLGISVD